MYSSQKVLRFMFLLTTVFWTKNQLKALFMHDIWSYIQIKKVLRFMCLLTTVFWTKNQSRAPVWGCTYRDVFKSKRSSSYSVLNYKPKTVYIQRRRQFDWFKYNWLDIGTNFCCLIYQLCINIELFWVLHNQKREEFLLKILNL